MRPDPTFEDAATTAARFQAQPTQRLDCQLVTYTLSVQLADGSRKSLSATTVTNFSSAARKAWKTMPKRQVGRPTGTKTSDRVSVTLRIDRGLWERFRMQENAGIIGDRCAEIEKLLAAIVSRTGEN